MARQFLSIDAKGLNVIEKTLRRLTPIGRASNRSALLGTADAAATSTAREMAQVKNIPVRLLKRRIQAFKGWTGQFDDPNAKPVEKIRLWAGNKRGIKASEHKGVLANVPGAFEATMPNGHTGFFVRTNPQLRWSRDPTRRTGRRSKFTTPNLPINDAQLFLLPELTPIMIKSASKAVKAGYAALYRKAFARRLKKLVKLKR